MFRRKVCNVPRSASFILQELCNGGGGEHSGFSVAGHHVGHSVDVLLCNRIEFVVLRATR